jgi:hypothetical protein
VNSMAADSEAASSNSATGGAALGSAAPQSSAALSESAGPEGVAGTDAHHKTGVTETPATIKGEQMVPPATTSPLGNYPTALHPFLMATAAEAVKVPDEVLLTNPFPSKPFAFELPTQYRCRRLDWFGGTGVSGWYSEMTESRFLRFVRAFVRAFVPSSFIPSTVSHALVSSGSWCSRIVSRV